MSNSLEKKTFLFSSFLFVTLLLFWPDSIFALNTTCQNRTASSDYSSLSPGTSWQTRGGFLLSGGTDTDRYSFTVSETGTHSFSFCSDDGGSDAFDSYLCLFNSAGTQLTFSDDVCGNNAKISYNITSTGTYYIQVSGYGLGDSGSYTLAYMRAGAASPPPPPPPPPSPPPSCTYDNGGTLSSGWNSKNFETPHNYSDNMTCGPTAAFTCPAGTNPKIWFQRFETESCCDRFSVLKASDDSVIQNLSGIIAEGFTRLYTESNSIKLRFTSDSSVTGWGVNMDWIFCEAPPPPSDTTPPNNVTNLSSSSHPNFTWKSDATVDVSWTAATDNTGGSGLDGYSFVWDTTSNTLPDSTKDIEENITSQTSPSLANGSSHYFHIRSKDNAGNWASGAVHLGPFYIDTTAPNAPTIQNPAASSVQSSAFWVQTSGDGDTGGSENTCYYAVWDSGVDDWTVNTTTRTCTTTTANSFQATVGPGLNCRTPGGTCTVYAFAQDGAGNNSSQATRSFIIEPILTFPSGTWQRLWYTTSGFSPNVSFGTFKGEGAGNNDKNGNPPDVTSAAFTTDWGGNNVAFGTPDTIGFKSSRTINFTTAGLYQFTIGADDGVRLFLDPIDETSTPFCDQWSTDGYRTKSCDASISAGDHKFRLDYYENTGNAKVSFGYTLVPCEGNVSLAVAPIPVTKGELVTLTASGLSNCNGKTVYFAGSDNTDLATLDPPFTNLYPVGMGTPVAQCVVSGGTCQIIHTPPDSWSGNIYYNAQIDKNDNDNLDTGDISNIVTGSINPCLKSTTRPSDAISVPLSNGNTCTVTLEHLGRDDSDTGAEQDNVSYETLQLDLNGAFPDSRKIGMDDNPNSGCQNNLQFTNEWTPGTGTLSLKSTKNEYGTFFQPTTHNLEYGYKLTAGSNCMFSSFTKQSCTIGNWQSPACSPPDISADKKSAESSQPWQPDLYIPWLIENAQYQYAVVPDNPPTITKSTLADKWYKDNPSLDVDFTDDLALDDVLYQIDSSTDTWTSLSTDNSGTSYTTNFSIPSTSWNNLSEGSHTIYFKATDDAGNGSTNSLTIKKDTLVPTATPNISGAASGSQRTAGPDMSLNTADDVFVPWFKEGTYYLDVADRENQDVGSGKYSGLDTTKCKYGIYDVGASEWTVPFSTARTCSSQTNTRQVRIDIDAAGYCGKVSGTGVGQSEGEGKCVIYLELYDVAGNINNSSNRWFYLNIDRTKPRAE